MEQCVQDFNSGHDTIRKTSGSQWEVSVDAFHSLRDPSLTPGSTCSQGPQDPLPEPAAIPQLNSNESRWGRQ
ncbi:hypothetical protein P7K49_000109, partial [Saguinus oedipus]